MSNFPLLVINLIFIKNHPSMHHLSPWDTITIHLIILIFYLIYLRHPFTSIYLTLLYTQHNIIKSIYTHIIRWNDRQMIPFHLINFTKIYTTVSYSRGSTVYYSIVNKIYYTVQSRYSMVVITYSTCYDIVVDTCINIG